MWVTLGTYVYFKTQLFTQLYDTVPYKIVQSEYAYVVGDSGMMLLRAVSNNHGYGIAARRASFRHRARVQRVP